MIHTVYLDDKYVNIRELLQEIRCQREGVHFESVAVANRPAQAYTTSEEFRRRAVVKINTFCDEHGIL